MDDDGVGVTGAGEQFYVPDASAPASSGQTSNKTVHYFLINNGRLRARENLAFIQFAGQKRPDQPHKPAKPLTPANPIKPAGGAMMLSLGVFRRAEQDRNAFHFAHVPVSVPVTSQYEEEFDFEYSKEMFMRAWRTARTGAGWRAHLPGLSP